ncbi:MAG TPA: hypothetical protein VD997_10120 [Phycisphaerales bacterium]|nr:hypothetical protein [Phycisphaerales bacterium]
MLRICPILALLFLAACEGPNDPQQRRGGADGTTPNASQRGGGGASGGGGGHIGGDGSR